ncbi:MAG: hypothetical protein RIS70_1226 [Planctomycetota bacterium]|jgi:prophage antirepressor-like protein
METTHGSLTQVFEYEGHGVRVAGTPELPLFVAADVCRTLGIGDTSRAIERLDDDEKGTSSIRTPGGTQQMLCVTESGLYSLILGSRKPEARAFKRWVTHEVLPTIRKTGRYAVDLSPAEHLLAQAQMLVDQERRQRALESRTNAIENRVAVVEARQAQGAPDFYSVVAYCNLRRLRLDLTMAIEWGRLASGLSRSLGIPVGRIKDPRFGMVNSYHIEVLDEVAARVS